jgi:inorganic triphosphatase YgiF
MNVDAQHQKSSEIELKVTLPCSDRDDFVRTLRKSAALARRKSVTQDLLSVYYDTPEQLLRKRRIALRVRQVKSSLGPVWVQTLKSGGANGSALSLRGEWEVNLQDSNLSRDALAATPWTDIDPDGAIFQALTPCFISRFERTSWQVRIGNQNVVEVALDIGQIEAGNHVAPICELEFELKAGDSTSLFDLAQNISASIAVLPAVLSKAERGYALAQGTLDMPQRSCPPDLKADKTHVAAAQQVFRESFYQFTRNLEILLVTDNPEVVHQARVGWRRFKSAMRLFKPVLVQDPIPQISSLQFLLGALGQLRDLDVALTETLPHIAAAYTSHDLDKQLVWSKFEQSLEEAARIERKSVHDALKDPVVGTTLLSITRYVEEMSATDAVISESKVRPLESWAVWRLEKLKKNLELSIEGVENKDREHRARILAKRLRYGLESMQAILPKRLAKRWLKKAAGLQGSIGVSRDFQRACQFAAEFGADASLVEFLRGYGCGIEHRNEG